MPSALKYDCGLGSRLVYVITYVYILECMSFTVLIEVQIPSVHNTGTGGQNRDLMLVNAWTIIV